MDANKILSSKREVACPLYIETGFAAPVVNGLSEASKGLCAETVGPRVGRKDVPEILTQV